MDIKQLATEVTIFLSPFLPYLVAAGEASVKEIGKDVGETAFKKAKSLWDKIWNNAQDNSKLKGAATILAEDPNDEDFQLTLAKLLAKQLEISPQLVSELMRLMQDDSAIQEILVKEDSKVKNIRQHLSKTGKQKVTVSGSSVTEDITQEQ